MILKQRNIHSLEKNLVATDYLPIFAMVSKNEATPFV